MLAEPADQQRLLELADLDADVAKVQHTARSLPEHQQIAELMTARQEAGEALVEATTVTGDLEEAVARAEADLTPVKQRLERNQKRIDDGSVSDGKTLRGLIDEVEHLKRRIGELEDIQLETMGQLEDAQAAKQRIEARKTEIETRLRELVTQRDKQVAELVTEAKLLKGSRDTKAQGIPTDLFGLYEKLRASRGSGAAALRRRRCTGCQLEIPVSDLDGYRKAPANQVLRCVECDRILVRVQESGL